MSPEWSRRERSGWQEPEIGHLMLIAAQMAAIAKSTEHTRGLAYLALEEVNSREERLEYLVQRRT
jgi:hypothetical protein